MGDLLTEPEWEAQFVTAPRPGIIGRADTLAQAQGVMLMCPCGQGHRLVVWFADRGVPAEREPGPGRWTARGTGLGDLTLAPSIAVGEPVCWHGHIEEGRIRG